MTPPVDEAAPRPLRLGWYPVIVGVALATAAFTIVRTLTAGILPSESPVTTVLCACAAAGLGIQLNGLFVYGLCRGRGTTFPVFPGERLWAYEAVLLLARFAPYLLLRTLERVLPPHGEFLNAYADIWIYAAEAAAALCGAFLYLYAARRAMKPWRAVFVAAAATHGALAAAVAGPMFFGFPTNIVWSIVLVVYCAQLIALIAAATVDRLARRSRPWSHWVGVLLPIWHLLVLLAAAGFYAFVHDLTAASFSAFVG